MSLENVRRLCVNHYEHIVIANPRLDEDKTQKTIEKITDSITKKGGIILKIDNWGLKKLAYELNKQKEGIYIYILFTAPPTCIPSLEKLYKVFDPIIKFMVIKLNKKETELVLSKLEATKKETDKGIEEEA